MLTEYHKKNGAGQSEQLVITSVPCGEEVVKTIMSLRHEIKELFDDDQHTVATGSIGYQPWILTAQNHEYLESLMANLIKGNEHYLATHKQVCGLMSMILYKTLENKPLDNTMFVRKLLLSRRLKYHLNKYMLKNGYKRSPAQMDHELMFLEPSTKAQVRCCYEDKADFKPTLEGGHFSLTPYGPPLPPKCQAFKKTYPASVVHGLIPYYIRTKEDEKIFVARDQAAWPSLFY
ncbi:hypothetical protein GE061_017752 [Apolygus lucorum]|uniref:Uncharacterized protein n=1 Tax=Apolygus lucorum TaxID=248454 RepID=A0A8S9XD64_APOLU|nr:hypothetical protein GE061_017752 [Apolygus lucorum]